MNFLSLFLVLTFLCLSAYLVLMLFRGMKKPLKENLNNF